MQSQENIISLAYMSLQVNLNWYNYCYYFYGILGKKHSSHSSLCCTSNHCANMVSYDECCANLLFLLLCG